MVSDFRFLFVFVFIFIFWVKKGIIFMRCSKVPSSQRCGSLSPNELWRKQFGGFFSTWVASKFSPDFNFNFNFNVKDDKSSTDRPVLQSITIYIASALKSEHCVTSTSTKLLVFCFFFHSYSSLCSYGIYTQKQYRVDMNTNKNKNRNTKRKIHFTCSRLMSHNA